MLSLKQFFAEAKSRKLTRMATIYLSASLTTLGVVNLFSSQYHLSPIIFDVALTLLACGFPAALINSWFHGQPDKQRVTKREIVVYALLTLTAALIVVRVVIHSPRAMFAANRKTIAVLPFKNLSDSKEDEYFSDGITEDIITQLSSIAELTVISRTSVMQYKDAKKSLRDIAADLDVATVLEGSVRRTGDRVRIVSQLIDARDDKHMWAETYDRELKDVFAIQSEVARNIAEALRATLSPDEIQHLERRNTTNLDAYAYYLRGRDYYYHYDREDNERAIELFRKALDLDPRYALAYAGLGDAYGQRATNFGFGDAWADSAIAVSTLSVSLDPKLAEGYKALGLAYEYKGQLRYALELYHKAVRQNPNYAPVVSNIGACYYSLGAYDEALRWMKKTVALQPGFARYHAFVGLQYFVLWFDSLASVWFAKALELQPDFIFPNVVTTYIHLYGGDTTGARATIASVLAKRPDQPIALDAAGDVELLTGNFPKAKSYYSKATSITSIEEASGNKLALALLRLGELKQSSAILDSNLAVYLRRITHAPDNSSLPYDVAQIFALRGKHEEAIRWLERAMATGYSDYRSISIDPLLENIRHDKRFDENMRGLKARVDAMRKNVQESEDAERAP